MDLDRKLIRNLYIVLFFLIILLSGVVFSYVPEQCIKENFENETCNNCISANFAILPNGGIFSGSYVYYNITLKNFGNLIGNYTFKVEAFDPEDKTIHSRTYYRELFGDDVFVLFPNKTTDNEKFNIIKLNKEGQYTIKLSGHFRRMTPNDPDLSDPIFHVFYSPNCNYEESSGLITHVIDVPSKWQYDQSIINSKNVEKSAEINEKMYFLALVGILFFILKEVFGKDFFNYDYKKIIYTTIVAILIYFLLVTRYPIGDLILVTILLPFTIYQWGYNFFQSPLALIIVLFWMYSLGCFLYWVSNKQR